jgi:tetratricopeptide (TPR) repeat protein
MARWHLQQGAQTNPSLLKSALYIRILSNHGIAYLAMEKYVESEKFHIEAIELCSQLGMEEYCSMGNLMQNLGSCYLWSSDLEKAEDTLQKALLQPNNNPEGAKYTMGNPLLRQKQYERALEFHKEVLHIYLTGLGRWHPTTSDSWHKLGSIFCTPDFPGRDVKEAE